MVKKKEFDFGDKYIKWFSELSNANVDVAGGKGASLGEMFNKKFPVPPGFVITAQAFDYFLNYHGLRDKILNIIVSIDMENTAELDKKSAEIRKMIMEQKMPEDLKEEIIESYHILGAEKIEGRGISQDALNILKNAYEPIFVSVRSSATTEDLADASFAGQQDSFLNVKGDYQIIENVKKCFASLYNSRAIYYRNKKGFQEEGSLLAAVIQKMVNSEKSGVIFSKNPMNFEDEIVIEAVYGLGTGIVSGLINPDNYVVSSDLKIKKIKIADKKIAIVRTGSGTNEKIKLNEERSKSQVLTNSQILEAADYALKLEQHYQKPQDIEFAVEDEKIYIVQSRPITTKAKRKTGKVSGKIILEGLGASPGIGVGIVKLIKTMEDLSKIKKGDVLVTQMTDPDMVVSMQKSTAIITDEGGMTSHAAIVSREMGIPAVVGTGEATKILKDGMKVTVDGFEGKIYEGQVAETTLAEVEPVVKTSKIKIKLIMDLPDFAERAAKSEIDSVGLLRLEGIIANSNKHPLLYEKENKLDDYKNLLKDGIEKISKHFKSIWIRSSDVRTDEFDSLKGSPEREINPMLGLHGIRFSLKHPKIFAAELKAISEIAEKYPEKKFGVMFPQVISIEEVLEAKKIFNEYAMENMVFGVMIETPAAVQIIKDIAKEVSFISFGTNDLTQFTLAVDRGDDNVQHLYNEMHPAVLSQIKQVIKECKGKVETSICGQAGSNEKMVEFLIKEGIDSISVNADAAKKVSLLVKTLEEQKENEKVEENTESKETHEIEKSQKQDKKWGWDVVCSNCNKQTNVPFKPKKGWPVYCKECYSNKKKAKKEIIVPELPDIVEEKTKEIDASADEIDRIEQKAEEILQEIKKVNLEEITQDKKTSNEKSIKKELYEKDKTLESGLNESTGIYKPEEDSEYSYSFDDDDEFSDVF